MTLLLRIIACLALFLGLGHIVFGLSVFRAYTLEMIWFTGAGVAMILTALTNLSAVTSPKHRLLHNTLMLIYALAILGVLPQIQAIIACSLFVALFIISALESFGPYKTDLASA